MPDELPSVKVDANYVHDIQSSLVSIYGINIAGIYHDDCLSGVETRGNIIDRVGGHSGWHRAGVAIETNRDGRQYRTR